MRAIDCQVMIDKSHKASFQFPEDIDPGVRHVLIVLDTGSEEDSSSEAPQTELDTAALMAASESSIAFWDNPKDNEVWDHV